MEEEKDQLAKRVERLKKRVIREVTLLHVSVIILGLQLWFWNANKD